MVNELSTSTHELTKGGEVILRVYRELVTFYDSPPTLHALYGQYSAEVDKLVVTLQATLYPDDFYDGSPHKRPHTVLPDSLRDNLSETIGIPENISFYEIAYVLDMLRFTYSDNGRLFNPPVKGVW